MASKRAVLYKKVPKPVKPGKGKTSSTVGHLVNCFKCGTQDLFTLEAMLDHEYWCDLAKEAAQKRTANKQKKKNRAPKRQ